MDTTQRDRDIADLARQAAIIADNYRRRFPRVESRDLEEHGRTRETATAPVAREEELRDPAIEDLAASAPDGDVSALPQWARDAIPESLRIPEGETVYVMRFLREWTKDRRQDRTCVMWQLSVGDEKLANQRGGDNSGNVLMELSKQMVRAVDGKKVDYSGRNQGASLDAWWNAIGRKCRTLIVSTFIKVHSLSDAEKAYFLAHCVAARTLSIAG